MYIAHVDSPVGVLTLASADDAILPGFWIDGQEYDCVPLKEETVWECGTDSLAVFRETTRWLKPYSSGQESSFHPRSSFSDPESREEIAREMLSVPYGRAASYKQLAESPAARQGKSYVPLHATGGIVAYNPLLILIPCHRITGVDGRLTGYVGGLGRKKCLFVLEAGQL